MEQLHYILLTILFDLITVDQILSNDYDVVPIESLTEESCSKRRNGCCSEIIMEDKIVLLQCVAIHSFDLTAINETEVTDILQYLTCMIECVYKKTRFIGKKDTLNMKMVKLRAAQIFQYRPKEKAYYIKAHEDCKVTAREFYDKIMGSPLTKSILKNCCRPFFTFLQNCVMNYHHTNECPYFRWAANEFSDPAQSCKKAKERCYEIDGLQVPLY